MPRNMGECGVCNVCRVAYVCHCAGWLADSLADNSSAVELPGRSLDDVVLCGGRAARVPDCGDVRSSPWASFGSTGRMRMQPPDFDDFWRDTVEAARGFDVAATATKIDPQ